MVGSSSKKCIRVLLINASNQRIKNGLPNVLPHTGFASLASVLKKRGHKVLVLDYAIFPKTPKVEYIIHNFKPDVIGITLFTRTKYDADAIIDKILEHTNAPIIVGGPHASLYYEDLETDRRLDYIIIGEAENIITEIVENAKKEDKPKIFKATLPSPEKIPFPDYTSFYNYEKIEDYPLSTSRGCPYHCSFCCTGLVSSRKWRPRPPDQCVEEIKYAKKILPNLKKLTIVDDNPTFDLNRFKEFTRLYLKENLSLKLVLFNLRADKIDEELLQLLKEAGCDYVVIGVEHGDPEVFKQIRKGETLENIKKAAEMINKFGFKLDCSFIIGLPGDTLKRTQRSIKFAKELKANYCGWNFISPHKGTKVREWYQQKGYTIKDEMLFQPNVATDSTIYLEPTVTSPDFTAEEQKKAYVAAKLGTCSYPLKVTFKLIPYVIRFRLYREYCYFIFLKIRLMYEKFRSSI